MSDELKMAREIGGIIRDAILAERERCAEVAENMFQRGMPKASGMTIAAAIRQLDREAEMGSLIARSKVISEKRGL